MISKKVRHVVKAHVKRHAHGYGIVAAILSIRLVPMAFEIAALLIADFFSRRWIGGA